MNSKKSSPANRFKSLALSVISTEAMHSIAERRNLSIFNRIVLPDRIRAMKTYYVYIMSSKTATLYIGITSNIKKRVYEHKTRLIPGFTDKYNIDRLVYVETFGDALSAIAREKQIKRWRREKKIALIESTNPQWLDLAADWYD
jgi:putative endonuclease